MRQPDVDPYEILGLERGASWDEIQTAYRRLAKKHHPDKNPGDQASEWIFKQVNQAHEHLRGIHGVQDDGEKPGSPQHREPEAREEPEEPATDDPKDDPPADAQRTLHRIGRSKPIEPWEFLVGNPPGPGVRRKPELGYFFTEVSSKERATPWQDLKRWGSTLRGRFGGMTEPQAEHLSGAPPPHHRRSFPMERWKAPAKIAGLLGIWALYLAPVTLLGMVLGLPWWMAAMAGLILGEWAGVVIFIYGLWLAGAESWWVLLLGGAIGGAIWSLLSGLWFLVVGGTASLAPSWIATSRLPARVRRKLRVDPPEPDSESGTEGHARGRPPPLLQDPARSEVVTSRLWCVGCDIDVLEEFVAAQHNRDFSCPTCGRTFDYVAVLEAVSYREHQALASHLEGGAIVDETRDPLYRVEGLKIVVEINP